MSLKLRLSALWTPRRVLEDMLCRVHVSTTAALDGLSEVYAPGAIGQMTWKAVMPEGDLEARRAAMASGHNARVRALVEALGREKAIELGRKALFPVGVALGREAKARLGAGESRADLERAARVLYRALGIHFRLEDAADGTMLLWVDRCALAGHYTTEACAMLSAADEGVVAGLNPKLRMRFEQRMTDGPAECLARIGEEGKCGL